MATDWDSPEPGDLLPWWLTLWIMFASAAEVGSAILASWAFVKDRPDAGWILVAACLLSVLTLLAALDLMRRHDYEEPRL